MESLQVNGFSDRGLAYGYWGISKSDHLKENELIGLGQHILKDKGVVSLNTALAPQNPRISSRFVCRHNLSESFPFDADSRARKVAAYATAPTVESQARPSITETSHLLAESPVHMPEPRMRTQLR